MKGFEMKKKILALAALATIAGAAQADVTLYGLLDVGVASEAHSNGANGNDPFSVDPYDPVKASNSSAGRVTGMVTGGMSMSRFGIKGDEDLGGGTSAGFVLESAINPTNGALPNASLTTQGTSNTNVFSSINGQLFSRGAYAKIAQQGIGELQLGRTTNLGLDQIAVYDPLNGSGLYSPLGFSGTLGGGGGATEQARLNNSIKYQGEFSGVKVGYQHKFGVLNSSELTDDSTADIVTAGYTMDKLSIQGTYGNYKDSISCDTDENVGSAGYTCKMYNIKGSILTAKYALTDTLNIKVGGEHLVKSAPSDTGLTGVSGATYYGTAIANITGGTGGALTDYNKSYSKVYNGWWIGGDYKVTANTTLATGYYQFVTNYGDGTSYQMNVMSAYLDYNFSKMTDAYVGVSSTTFTNDNHTSGTTLLNNSIYGAGLRVRF
jgi:predicted porin